ncbi:MAG: putative sulfate exporter family transporter, partial [Anaerolineae bacterium]
NVDTTAAVVGAGTIYGKTAQQIASIVKQTQNALIGVVAFLLALYFSVVVEGKKERPSAAVIWQRFPKFVLGFIVTSLLFTFGLIAKDPGAAIAAMKDWAFCLAFVCMGLELSAGQIKKMGWNPIIVYLIVTVFNTVLALIVSYLIFGWLFPAKL